MQGKIRKRLILKRCFGPDGSNVSFEDLISQIEQVFQEHKDRASQSGLFRSQIISYISSPSNGKPGKLIGICNQDMSATGLVDLVSSKETVEIEEFDAPEDRGWLEYEIVLYVVENHVVACNIGNSEKTISTLISDLAKKGDIVSDSSHFLLSDVPNKPTVSQVSKIGVKHINLDITAYMDTLDYVKPEHPIEAVLSSIFASRLGEPDTYAKRAQTKGKLVLSRGRAFKKDEISKDEWLTKIGTTIINEEIDDYTMTLEDGSQISSSSLKVSKHVQLNKHGNSFSRKHAHLELINYYEELKANGSLSW